MLRISYFWPDWNSYVRLGAFHTIFSTKKVAVVFSPQNLSLKLLIIRFLTSVSYCKPRTRGHTHEPIHRPTTLYNKQQYSNT